MLKSDCDTRPYEHRQIRQQSLRLNMYNTPHSISTIKIQNYSVVWFRRLVAWHLVAAKARHDPCLAAYPATCLAACPASCRVVVPSSGLPDQGVQPSVGVQLLGLLGRPEPCLQIWKTSGKCVRIGCGEDFASAIPHYTYVVVMGLQLLELALVIRLVRSHWQECHDQRPVQHL